jgi:hypothetical protein
VNSCIALHHLHGSSNYEVIDVFTYYMELYFN